MVARLCLCFRRGRSCACPFLFIFPLMTNEGYKQFARTAKKQIEGEAFFETLICACSIPHKVVAPKDLGIDFFCEWAPDNKPTGILFAAQVKASSEEVAEPKQVDRNPAYDDNELDKFKISNSNLKIDENTLKYWAGLGMPVYLFTVIESTSEPEGKKALTIYYKRYTAYLHEKDKKEEYDPFDSFYKVSDGAKFLTYKDPLEKKRGFARDLFIDYIRCCYSRGTLPYVNPTEIGVGGYEHYKQSRRFDDLLNEYKNKILTTFSETKEKLERAGLINK